MAGHEVPEFQWKKSPVLKARAMTERPHLVLWGSLGKGHINNEAVSLNAKVLVPVIQQMSNEKKIGIPDLTAMVKRFYKLLGDLFLVHRNHMCSAAAVGVCC